MLVNRSGYYKWLARKDKPNRYEQDRIILTELLLEQHNKHKTKGYHYLANLIRNETGWVFSDNLAHKCCKLAGIRSKTKRGRKIAGRENIKFPNIIKGKSHYLCYAVFWRYFYKHMYVIGTRFCFYYIYSLLFA